MRKWSRRRFLALFGGLLGAGAVGASGVFRSGSAGPDALPASTSTTGAPSSATLGSPSTVTTTTGAVSAAAPSTTTVPASTSTLPPAATSSTTTTAPPTTVPSTTVPPTTAPASTTLPPATTVPPTTTTTISPTTTQAAVSGGSTQLICKDAWGARPVAGEFVGHEIERLTVHHTAVVLGSNTQAPGRARQHQRFHQEQGWPDLAYHFMVDAHGYVYEGRPLTARGDTFTAYDPSGHFLVCAEGNFDEQSLPDAQVAALVEVLAWGAATFGVDPATIAGHRDYAGTSCPGAALYSLVRDGVIEGRVRDRLAAGPVALPVICGAEGAALVADIEAGRV